MPYLENNAWSLIPHSKGNKTEKFLRKFVHLGNYKIFKGHESMGY